MSMYLHKSAYKCLHSDKKQEKITTKLRTKDNHGNDWSRGHFYIYVLVRLREKKMEMNNLERTD